MDGAMSDWLSLLLVIVAPLCAAALLLTFVWSNWRWGITPMPTSPHVERVCVKLLQDALQGRDGVSRHARVAELGSGFGTLARGIGRAIPSAQVEALEGNGPIHAISVMLDRVVRAFRRLPMRRVTYRRADFMQEPLAEYDAVVCYLYPGAMMPLARKLTTTLPDGAWVVSNTFALPGWKPIQVVRANDFYKSPVYLYRVPQSLDA
jgi:hypothetical protein